MSKILISAIDIRPDKIICLIAQELQIVNQGNILQLIGSGISRFPIDCIDPFSLNKDIFFQHISEAIKKSESEASTKVRDVYVNISDSVHSDCLDFIRASSSILDFSRTSSRKRSHSHACFDGWRHHRQVLSALDVRAYSTRRVSIAVQEPRRERKLASGM